VEKIKILKDRSDMLQKSRDFFRQRSVYEVDCPIMSPSASIDVHINLIRAYGTNSQTRYLHPSPEYAMKRLLSEGMGDIYQLSHVFRDNEVGMRHNPEFTLAEWYRLGITFPKMIEETIDFIRLFVGNVKSHSMSYRDAFIKYTGIDYLTTSKKKMLNYLEEQGIDVYHNINEEGKDGILNVIMGVVIQPNLGHDQILAITHFPATQAALAQTKMVKDEEVSERFEVFYKGLELANGYHELTEPGEQHKRLIEANSIREKLGKDSLPVDENFLEALKKGLPDCCGVAVGFDRLMMLRHSKEDIAEVIPFAEW
jgi:lysyl-tRNA synthetase class 2